jgi:hypothetical protein
MMRKTRALVLAVLVICVASGAFAAAKGNGLALGGEGALYLAGSGGLPASAMFVFHLPQLPLMFGVGATTTPSIGVTADYWLAHGNLVSILSWYAGVGAYLLVDLGGDSTIGVGGRIPLGLQAWPFGSTLEIFLEVAPAVGVIIVPTAFEWHLQGAIGLRVWL